MPELVIDSNNYGDFVHPVGAVSWDGQDRMLTCLPRTTTYGRCTGATPIHEALDLIPESRWRELIDEKDKDHSWLHDMVEGVIPCLDQGSLGYCWAYGTTLNTMVDRLSQGLPFVLLAPESLGPSVGWKNTGNSVDGALQQVRRFGLCANRFLDAPHSLEHQRWKPGWEADCANHRVLEWWDLDQEGQVWNACMTCALSDVAYAGGFSWWGHLVCGGFRARYNKGRYELLYRNSWGPTYGEEGFFWMAQDKGTPDIGAFAARQATLSEV